MLKLFGASELLRLESLLDPIFLGSTLVQSTRLTSLLDHDISKWPLMYLGLPLGGNPKSISFRDSVLDIVSMRLDGWKKAFLSLGGRITLIQSCLMHIPSYYLSLFKISASIALRIEKLRRDFLRSRSRKGKRVHLVSWNILYKPKKFGGLRFGNITLRNQALWGKWFWRYPQESFTLWHQGVMSIYRTYPNG